MRRRPVAHRIDVALALRRRPRQRRAVVMGLALLCGLAVMAVVQRAEEAAASWGERSPVLVATRDLGAGAVLSAGNTRVEHRPSRFVPDRSLDTLPGDGRLAEAVYAHEVVREERLAPGGLSEVAARVPTGARAMAIPVEPGQAPALVIGDRVDVLVALPAEVAGDGAPGFALATDVPVVDVTDAAVTVAVPAHVAPRLAVAFGAGAVILALTGAG